MSLWYWQNGLLSTGSALAGSQSCCCDTVTGCDCPDCCDFTSIIVKRVASDITLELSKETPGSSDYLPCIQGILPDGCVWFQNGAYGGDPITGWDQDCTDAPTRFIQIAFFCQIVSDIRIYRLFWGIYYNDGVDDICCESQSLSLSCEDVVDCDSLEFADGWVVETTS
jgi:hypothetical protein